jgi:alpha-D-ribose 1-methylphosphonate 5-triphosphate diphosphatase
MNKQQIINANIVTPQRILYGASLEIEDGIISSITESAHSKDSSWRVFDAENRWLLPGFIDIHNDSLEKELEPRPGTVFPLEVALLSLENKLISHGITTMFHSLSFRSGREGRKRGESVEQIMKSLASLRPLTIMHHFIHARVELPEVGFEEMVHQGLVSGDISLISFMDHTPGQGQYRNPEKLRYYLKHHEKMSDGKIDEHFQKILDHRKSVDTKGYFERTIALANECGIPSASHDDDSVEKVMDMHDHGVSISEFPVELEVARAADRCGMHIAVGAPNVLRGKSHSGNMSAREAIEVECADIICSDYFPPAMLHAVFTLYREGNLPLHEIVNMVSLNPAQSVKMDESIGSVEPGKHADLILVQEVGETVIVEDVFVNGILQYHRGPAGSVQGTLSPHLKSAVSLL